jgi:hypothetical protein
VKDCCAPTWHRVANQSAVILSGPDKVSAKDLSRAIFGFGVRRLDAAFSASQAPVAILATHGQPKRCHPE